MANSLFLCYKVPRMATVSDPIVPNLNDDLTYLISPFVSELSAGIIDVDGLVTFQNDAIYHLFRRLVKREEFDKNLRVWLRDNTESFFYTKIDFAEIESRAQLDEEIDKAYERMHIIVKPAAELTLSWVDWPWTDL